MFAGHLELFVSEGDLLLVPVGCLISSPKAEHISVSTPPPPHGAPITSLGWCGWHGLRAVGVCSGLTYSCRGQVTELAGGMPVSTPSSKSGWCIGKTEHPGSETSQCKSRAWAIFQTLSHCVTCLSLHFLVCKVKAGQPP